MDAARQVLEKGSEFEEAGDFEQAFHCYLEAAMQGNPEAQVNLGNLYDEGRGCVRDPGKAVYWYKRAVKSGCAYGANNLGAHYRQAGNIRWAKYWFIKAAEMGYDMELPTFDTPSHHARKKGRRE